MTNRLKKCVNYFQTCASYKALRQVLLAAMCFSASPLFAGEVLVAVASNFIQPMKVIAERFEAETGHQAKLAFGSSGKLFAQVRHGAPFDVFLSADEDKVSRLLERDLAVTGSEFVYAKGRLVLWSAKADVVDEHGDILKRGSFEHLAVANPKLAPYGAAAQSVLKQLELYEPLSTKKVIGENIAQTFQFVQTGNAELGLVAWSQIKGLEDREQGSAWLIPSSFHPPIEQYAVLLNRASDKPAASALIEFLRRESSQTLIRDFGYD